jgi:hypothetical protein
MDRLASGPGRADDTFAFIQVTISINQCHTSRFSEYIIKATTLLVSESGASRKNKTKGGNCSLCAFDLGVKGVVLTLHMPKKKMSLDAHAQKKCPWML